MEGIDYILDTHLVEYTWQAFHMFYALNLPDA